MRQDGGAQELAWADVDRARRREGIWNQTHPVRKSASPSRSGGRSSSTSAGPLVGLEDPPRGWTAAPERRGEAAASLAQYIVGLRQDPRACAAFFAVFMALSWACAASGGVRGLLYLSCSRVFAGCVEGVCAGGLWGPAIKELPPSTRGQPQAQSLRTTSQSSRSRIVAHIPAASDSPVRSARRLS